jgi:hypothetical protein
MPSSGIWRRVDILLTDVSEERIASIRYSYLLTLVHRSWISSTLNMEAIRSSETSVNKISARRHIPEDEILQDETCFFIISTVIIIVTAGQRGRPCYYKYLSCFYLCFVNLLIKNYLIMKMRGDCPVLCRHVVRRDPKVSEEHIASIFRV